MFRFKVIFFDLGSTLVYPQKPWAPIYIKADDAMLSMLNHAGIPFSREKSLGGPGGFIRYYYGTLPEDYREKTSFAALRELLSEEGFGNVSEDILRSALTALYTVTRQNWCLEEDAPSTLTLLKEQGYRLAMISNTSDDLNLQKIIDQWNLRPYFETMLNSAAFGYRKPDQRIFKEALKRMNVQPQDAVMIGDTLEADVLGANLAGIYSIWITRRVQNIPEGELRVQPQAVVSCLDEIPALLHEIEQEQTDATA